LLSSEIVSLLLISAYLKIETLIPFRRAETSMARDDDSTRRRFLTSGALLGAGMLAGCTGGDGSGGSGQNTGTAGRNGTTTGTTESTENTGSAETTDGSSGSGSYSVSMAPVGEVTFEQVPKRWIAGTGDWADMGVALGVGAPNALWLPDRFNSHHYEELPGVSVDKSSITALYSDGVDKEVFYELDSDVHVFDPNFLANRFKGWEQADIAELRKRVAPYFGNTIFSREYPWHSYRYYTLYEAFGKLAEVFDRQDRYRQFASVHEGVVNDVRSQLPAEGDRPSVAVVYPQPVDEPEAFLPYPMGRGTTFAHMHTLGLQGAFGKNTKAFTNDRGEVDYETLLEIDPDALLLLGHEMKSAKQFRNTVVSYLRNQEIASQLSAVRNEGVYRAGGLYQGPIINLFLIERLGRDLYPDAFGSEPLFDRERVASIVTGN
jgi:iron complex transport system substrate-binding protein